METNHTPGPWACHDTSYHAHDYRLSRPDGSPLPVNAPYNDHSEQRANARLIACAPEMLAELQANAEAWERVLTLLPAGVRSIGSVRLMEARAAIAKATGPQS